MGKRKREQRRRDYDIRQAQHEQVIERIPLERGCKLIMVYVEGYEDVAFWRSVFDDYESDEFMFEISVPLRNDLAKGKKVVLHLAEDPEVRDTLFCIDSDFDYLFADQTPVSREINRTPHIFHTYAYATENYLCYAPSLHNICVKATKNDTNIFDFEKFFADYSRTIYPLFLWYAYSAQIATPNIFPLIEFKSSVKLNYLEVEGNGAETLAWLERQVQRRLRSLRGQHPDIERQFPAFIEMLGKRGVTPENTYLFMQGHTLMDNVVMPVLEAVCDKLRYMSISRINGSDRRGGIARERAEQLQQRPSGRAQCAILQRELQGVFPVQKTEARYREIPRRPAPGPAGLQLPERLTQTAKKPRPSLTVFRRPFEYLFAADMNAVFACLYQNTVCQKRFLLLRRIAEIGLGRTYMGCIGHRKFARFGNPEIRGAHFPPVARQQPVGRMFIICHNLVILFHSTCAPPQARGRKTRGARPDGTSPQTLQAPRIDCESSVTGGPFREPAMQTVSYFLPSLSSIP